MITNETKATNPVRERSTAKGEMTAREAAVRMLLSVIKEEKFSGEGKEKVLSKISDKKERALASRLFEGSLEREVELTYLLNQFSKTPVHKMKPAIRCILFITVYQLKFMDKIPPSAACNEAVKLSVKFGFSGLKGFVNGVARAIARTEKIPYPERDTDMEKYLSVRYSIPPVLVKLFLSQYSTSQTEAIFSSFLKEQKGVTLRCFTSNVSKEKFMERLSAADISFREGVYDSEALHVISLDSPERIPLFKEGAFYIQDESSMQAVLAAGLKGTEKVLDLCAAPGGKSCMAADILLKNGNGTVDARDCSQKKCDLILENKSRLKLTNLTVSVSDATKENDKDRGRYDVVFADVPCSGLGILRKKPDIKHFYTERDENNLCLLQKKILMTAYEAVKEDGILIFSTCTLNKNENMTGFNFLKNECKMVPESLNPFLSEKLHTETTEQGYLLMLPDGFESDGFFLSRFRKPIR